MTCIYDRGVKLFLTGMFLFGAYLMYGAIDSYLIALKYSWDTTFATLLGIAASLFIGGSILIYVLAFTKAMDVFSEIKRKIGVCGILFRILLIGLFFTGPLLIWWLGGTIVSIVFGLFLMIGAFLCTDYFASIIVVLKKTSCKPKERTSIH